MCQVKIVATIGLATCSSEKLEELLDTGINVARFNMSHGTSDWHRIMIQRVRHLSMEKQTPLAILVDLAGPKIRVENLPKEGKQFIRDQRVSLISRTSAAPTTRQKHIMDNGPRGSGQTSQVGPLLYNLRSSSLMRPDKASLALSQQTLSPSGLST